ncbi:uncharacterized protein LOC135083184 [Ostrinia nubilalis]|uniref:uncharacterized protein LOC135083184 n=1 Tax=Ostrinia nubilalis TaxID=29057 RepID=UPI003082508F
MSDNEDLLGDDLGDHSLADYNLGNEEEEQLLADDYESNSSQNVPASVGPTYGAGPDLVSPEYPSHGMDYGAQPLPYQPGVEPECVVPNITVEIPNTPIPDHSTYAPYEPPAYEIEHAVVPPAIPAAPLESPQIVPSDMPPNASNGEIHIIPRERFTSERTPGSQRLPQIRDIPDSLDKVVIPRGGRGRTTWRNPQLRPQHPYRRNNMHRGNFNQRPSFPPPQIRSSPPQVRPDIRPEMRHEMRPDVPPEIRPEIHQVRPEIRPEVMDIRIDTRPDMRPDNMRPDMRPDMRPEVHPNPNMRPDMHPDMRPDLRPDMRPEGRPNMRPDMRPDFPPEIRPDFPPEMRPELRHDPHMPPQMGPEISPERPLMPDFRPDIRPFGPRFQFRPEEPHFRPNFEPRPMFFRPNFNPRPFGPPVREIMPGAGHIPQVTIRQHVPVSVNSVNKVDSVNKFVPKREQEVIMLPVQLPPLLPPGGLAGKKVLINPHFKGNFTHPVEVTGLPAYIPTRIQKSPPPSPTLESKFGILVLKLNI